MLQRQLLIIPLFILVISCISSPFTSAAEQKLSVEKNSLSVYQLPKLHPHSIINFYAFLKGSTIYYSDPYDKPPMILQGLINIPQEQNYSIYPSSLAQLEFLYKYFPDTKKQTKASNFYDVTETLQLSALKGATALVLYDQSSAKLYFFGNLTSKKIFDTQLASATESSPILKSLQLDIYSIKNSPDNLNKQPDKFNQEEKVHHLTVYNHSTSEGFSISDKENQFNGSFTLNYEKSYSAGNVDLPYMMCSIDFTFKNKQFSTQHQSTLLSTPNESKSVTLGLSADKESIYYYTVIPLFYPAHKPTLVKQVDIETIPKFAPKKPVYTSLTLSLNQKQIALLTKLTQSLSPNTNGNFDITEKYFKENTAVQSTLYKPTEQSLHIIAESPLIQRIKKSISVGKIINSKVTYKIYKIKSQHSYPTNIKDLKKQIPLHTFSHIAQDTEVIDTVNKQDLTLEIKSLASLTPLHTRYTITPLLNSQVDINMKYQNTVIDTYFDFSTTELEHHIKKICNIGGYTYIITSEILEQ